MHTPAITHTRQNISGICLAEEYDEKRMADTFFFATAQTADCITGNAILPLNHGVKALISKCRIESSLHDSEKVLGSFFARLFVMYYASVKPPYGSFHRLGYARSNGKARYWSTG